PIFLCTTFLPPVTHSENAVVRFYRGYGISDESLGVVRQKANWELEEWKRHIAKYQRIDIVDRFTLEEYFAAPEYYQMPLEPEELSEQLAKLMELLTFENYSICLTPEAVDLCYEIRKPEVRIRTDRRNKGQPRMGKITELALQDLRLAEMFEREFWSTFRSTESRFKDKTQVIKWCEERVKKYSGP